MLRFLLVFVFSLGCVLGQVNWVTRARVHNHSGYFSRVVQELVYDLEKLEWCNLKMEEYSQPLNESLYQWHVNGTVTYTNGFVISIHDLDITNIEQSIANTRVDGVLVPHARVFGRLNMRNVKIGFDVLVDLVDPEPPHAPQQRYTGHYTHTTIQLHLEVSRNLLTKEMTASPSRFSLSAGSGIKMIYMPANNLTEVLARRYQPSLNYDSISLWCNNIFKPMLVDISTNRVEFPEICFSNNCA